MFRFKREYIFQVILLAAIYFIAARLGLSLAFEAQQISVVWPPTGLAIAAVLFSGPRVWPGIMLGAFCANYSVAPYFFPALSISAGNTLESLIAYWLLRRFFEFDYSLRHLKDGMALILCGALFAPVVSATIGVASLCASGLEQWTDFGRLWSWWWLGDCVGGLVITPLLLTCAQFYCSGSRIRPKRIRELLFLLTLLIVAGSLLFAKAGGKAAHHPLEYVFFPFVVWAAFRFGQLETALVTALGTTTAIIGTLHGTGPFSGPSLHENLVLLQSYVAVLACTGLLLSAAVSESALEHKQRLDVVRSAEHRKDEFIAMLAHELRNPLAPVRNSLYLLKSLASDPKEVLKLHAIMERQLGHMVRLIDDLLDVSRVTWGTLALKRKNVELSSIIDTALESSSPILRDAGITQELERTSTALWVNGDETRLAQAVSNLLNNAANYTEPGGKVAITCRASGHVARIQVKDTGRGIAAERLQNIFDMFMRTENNRDGAKHGLGIGLALVKRLVELHGGTVAAESSGIGHGSTFTIELPLVEAPVSQTSHPEQGQSDHAGSSVRRKILVVDDNEDLAESLGQILLKHGNIVRVVHDGPAALETAQIFEPDLIFLDIGMPLMSGYEVARQIRAQPKLKNVLLVAQTGWGRTDDVQKAMDAGFDRHLIKPFDIDALNELLASL